MHKTWKFKLIPVFFILLSNCVWAVQVKTPQQIQPVSDCDDRLTNPDSIATLSEQQSLIERYDLAESEANHAHKEIDQKIIEDAVRQMHTEGQFASKKEADELVIAVKYKQLFESGLIYRAFADSLIINGIDSRQGIKDYIDSLSSPIMKSFDKIKVLSRVKNIVKEFLGSAATKELTEFPLIKRAKLLNLSLQQFNELAIVYKNTTTESSDNLPLAIYLKIKQNPAKFAAEINRVLPRKQYLFWGRRITKTINTGHAATLKTTEMIEDKTLTSQEDKYIQFKETLESIIKKANANKENKFWEIMNLELLLRQIEKQTNDSYFPRLEQILNTIVQTEFLADAIAAKKTYIYTSFIEGMFATAQHACFERQASFETIQRIRSILEIQIKNYKTLKSKSIDQNESTWWNNSAEKLLERANETYSSSGEWSKDPSLKNIFSLQYRIDP